MMIKCQKCGFENQMGSIFCRDCGEKLDMDAIDPNKLQKDVNKEKSIKLAKKRIKEAVSTGIALLVVAAFIAVVFYNGGLRKYEEPAISAASARQKFDNVANGVTSGKVTYSYPEVNSMFKEMVVRPLSVEPAFARVDSAEIAYDEEKDKSVIYLWITLKDKVPVIYTIHGDFTFYPLENGNRNEEAPAELFDISVSRLDIGRLPIFVNTKTFIDGFSSLVQNDNMKSFFARAQSVEFNAQGMTVDFGGPVKNAPSASSAKTATNKPTSSTAKAALTGGSAAVAANNEKAEAAKRKAEEEQEKKKQLEEERKRKAEEYKQQQKEKEEERKRKAEEEKERKKQEAEEKRRRQEEENERRRREREDRRNNNYNNNNRNSRSSRSSRNRY